MPKINPQIAEEILIHHLGSAPTKIEQLTGGRANFVYEATIKDETYVVRISDEASKLKRFLKEQWAVARAKEKKVPVPEILEVGNEASTFPYMIVKKAEGRPAEKHPERMRIIKEMAEYTAIINSIPTSGYGEVFEWSSNKLSRNETWKDFLHEELEIEMRIEILEKTDMLTEPGLTKLRRIFKEMASWNHKPTLGHGDMRLKNILVNEKGIICCVLDWENCLSSIAPYWDLSIALHDLTIDEKQCFVQGYGLSGQEFRKISPFVQALNIINYVPFVERAYIAKDKVRLEEFRTRLHGAFDMYTFNEEPLTKILKRWLPFKIGE
jgi:aminoglycoside phosphotransferase (APT) family kinase protein